MTDKVTLLSSHYFVQNENRKNQTLLLFNPYTARKITRLVDLANGLGACFDGNAWKFNPRLIRQEIRYARKSNEKSHLDGVL